MSHPPYRTRSDTLKLQRLIHTLKERGSNFANVLETTASNFLRDDSDGSSFEGYPEAKDGEEEEWGSDWEEDTGEEDKCALQDAQFQCDINVTKEPATCSRNASYDYAPTHDSKKNETETETSDINDEVEQLNERSIEDFKIQATSKAISMDLLENDSCNNAPLQKIDENGDGISCCINNSILENDEDFNVTTLQEDRELSRQDDVITNFQKRIEESTHIPASKLENNNKSNESPPSPTCKQIKHVSFDMTDSSNLPETEDSDVLLHEEKLQTVEPSQEISSTPVEEPFSYQNENKKEETLWRKNKEKQRKTKYVFLDLVLKKRPRLSRVKTETRVKKITRTSTTQ
ncbi:unnamed protein product [Lepeophtheirus salmonis]|uniref:(salmon louse) hypothetical protein n=1 Tax=Lepeophtheirus salmonis TaxID=72036 RepID=A0A7R8CV27_LEPSM|nr:unnamed protein product [Lepeophtheirus salmonis]CAF2890439.1 unnamed protein product [Lepeophtheirus salmonis]